MDNFLNRETITKTLDTLDDVAYELALQTEWNDSESLIVSLDGLDAAREWLTSVLDTLPPTTN